MKISGLGPNSGKESKRCLLSNGVESDLLLINSGVPQGSWVRFFFLFT